MMFCRSVNSNWALLTRYSASIETWTRPRTGFKRRTRLSTTMTVARTCDLCRHSSANMKVGALAWDLRRHSSASMKVGALACDLCWHSSVSMKVGALVCDLCRHSSASMKIGALACDEIQQEQLVSQSS